MQKINKKHGADTVVIGSQIRKPEREVITSGSLEIDVALGGGWAVGHWIEVVGHESAGKSLIVLKTIAANQKRDPNFTTIWFATEDFVEDYAVMLGVDLDRVIVENLNELESVYQHCIDFMETKAIDCIVIDSLPGLVPIREDDATMEDFQPGLVAFLTGKFFRKSQHSIKRSLVAENDRPVTGFVINQWREKIGVMRGDPRTTPGGKGKNFFFFQRVDVQRAEWIDTSKGRHIGQTIRVKNIKNKYAPPGREGLVDAYFASGNGHRAGEYDLVKDIVSAGTAYDVITRPDKSHYEFGDLSWFGRPNMEADLRDDPALRKRLHRAVLAAASKPLPAPAQRPVKRAPAKKAAAKKAPAKRAAARA